MINLQGLLRLIRICGQFARVSTLACVLMFQNDAQAKTDFRQLEADSEKEVNERCLIAKYATDRSSAGSNGRVSLPASLTNWFSEKVGKDIVLRKKLVHHLQRNDDSSVCMQFVKEKLREIRLALKEKTFEPNRQKFRPFVMIAVAAGLEEGKAVLTDLSELDESGDWLLSLRSFDPESYSLALESTAERHAKQLRSELALNFVPEELYGKTRENVFTEKSVRFRNPLLLHSYLSLLIEKSKAPTPDVWARLNVLYSTMGRQDKTTATKLFEKLIADFDTGFIMSFRRESVWVQFRLLPLAAAAGGPEVVRELMWLGEHSIDEQMKLLASSSLDRILERPASSNAGSTPSLSDSP